MNIKTRLFSEFVLQHVEFFKHASVNLQWKGMHGKVQ